MKNIAKLLDSAASFLVVIVICEVVSRMIK
jgi:hypothetical protein